MKPLQDFRPWGNFIQFTNNEKSTVKILQVKPKKKLSYQFHKKREEFWVVLSGDPIIVINDKEFQSKKGQYFVIKKEDKHRIIGGKKHGKILEISFGNFDENDIVRLEDDYNRI